MFSGREKKRDRGETCAYAFVVCDYGRECACERNRERASPARGAGRKLLPTCLPIFSPCLGTFSMFSALGSGTMSFTSLSLVFPFTNSDDAARALVARRELLRMRTEDVRIWIFGQSCGAWSWLLAMSCPRIISFTCARRRDIFPLPSLLPFLSLSRVLSRALSFVSSALYLLFCLPRWFLSHLFLSRSLSLYSSIFPAVLTRHPLLYL